MTEHSRMGEPPDDSAAVSADERLRLVNALDARQRLLETMLSIQRSIAMKQPLQDLLDAVTSGTASLLDRATVALVLPVPGSECLAPVSTRGPANRADNPFILDAAAEAITSHRIVSRIDESDPNQTKTIIAAPIVVRGVAAGGLAAEIATGQGSDVDQHQVLAAFAQQASLALTEARVSEAIHKAQHDAITGLPNRGLFLERLNQSISTGNKRLTDVTILLVDIHRFKAVNDSLGHKAGDAVLSAVAERIRSTLRSSDLTARVGGDEFGVLLEGAGTQAGTRIARSIVDAIRQPLRISGRSVYLSACVGVASCRTSSAESGDLFNSADLAMNRAISAGPGRIEVFQPHMHAEILERINLLDDLQVALARTQLRLQYQPLVDLATGEPVGVEALARWRHPQRGDVAPSTFIPLAEETGLILDLGLWILREGCRQIAEWRQLVPGIRLNINVSARQAMDPRFVERVEATLAETQLPGPMLTLELTESMLMGDPERAMVQLRQLKNLGVKLSIDDFGTGYSSLSYLRQFPVDQLKIDRTFITGAASSKDELAVTKTVMDLGRTLRLETVAEGIEDAQQLDVLRTIGCDLGQGFLLARPMDPGAVHEYFDRLMSDRQRTAE
ncbi:MAG: bifunctional diguanylate cyclase/phosphodiesterase [Micromonosporaceae bacterium]|nr:bifunctional diguanylate cyclase/phosphodiesterase [Micromonosporaceae bacterium]